jgi:hypothetical protein
MQKGKRRRWRTFKELRWLSEMLAVTVAVAAVTAGCGGPSAFKTTSPLAARQLAAMTTYYEAHNGRQDYQGPVGCAVDPLGERKDTSGRLTVYSNVACQGCPLSGGLGGAFPAVFQLQGTHVLGIAEANAPGDPLYFNEVKRLFPHALWNKAGSPPSNTLRLQQAERTAR